MMGHRVEYCVLLHKGVNDPGEPISHDSHWKSRHQAEAEASRHDLTDQQRGMGWHYSVAEVHRKKNRRHPV